MRVSAEKELEQCSGKRDTQNRRDSHGKVPDKSHEKAGEGAPDRGSGDVLMRPS